MKAHAVASVRTSVEAAKTAHDAGWRCRCLSISSADMWMRTPGAKGRVVLHGDRTSGGGGGNEHDFVAKQRGGPAGGFRLVV